MENRYAMIFTIQCAEWMHLDGDEQKMIKEMKMDFLSTHRGTCMSKGNRGMKAWHSDRNKGFTVWLKPRGSKDH